MLTRATIRTCGATRGDVALRAPSVSRSSPSFSLAFASRPFPASGQPPSGPAKAASVRPRSLRLARTPAHAEARIARRPSPSDPSGLLDVRFPHSQDPRALCMEIRHARCTRVSPRHAEAYVHRAAAKLQRAHGLLDVGRAWRRAHHEARLAVAAEGVCGCVRVCGICMWVGMGYVGVRCVGAWVCRYASSRSRKSWLFPDFPSPTHCATPPCPSSFPTP